MLKKSKPALNSLGLETQNPSKKFKSKQDRKEVSLRFFLTNVPTGIGKEGDRKILLALGKNPGNDGYQIIVPTMTTLTSETLLKWKLVPYVPKSKRPLIKYYAVDPDYMPQAIILDPFTRIGKWLQETGLMSSEQDILNLIKDYIKNNTSTKKEIANKKKDPGQSNTNFATHSQKTPGFKKIPMENNSKGYERTLRASETEEGD